MILGMGRDAIENLTNTLNKVREACPPRRPLHVVLTTHPPAACVYSRSTRRATTRRAGSRRRTTGGWRR